MRPDDRDLFNEGVVDLLVALVGRRVYERLDPKDPRHEPFFEWLAREARLSQTAGEHRDTERGANSFAERVMQRVAATRAGERHRVRCVDEGPVTYPGRAAAANSDAPTAPPERTTPWWDLAVAAGSGRELWDEPAAAFIGLPDDVAEGSYVALRVAGDSMCQTTSQIPHFPTSEIPHPLLWRAVWKTAMR